MRYYSIVTVVSSKEQLLCPILTLLLWYLCVWRDPGLFLRDFPFFPLSLDGKFLRKLQMRASEPSYLLASHRDFYVPVSEGTV